MFLEQIFFSSGAWSCWIDERGRGCKKTAEEAFRDANDVEQAAKVATTKEESIHKQIEPSRDSLLHWAARHGKLETVKALLVRKADPQTRNAKGFTPLLEAAVRGHMGGQYLDIAKALVGAVEESQQKNYIEIKNNSHKSALDLAKNDIKTYLESVQLQQPSALQSQLTTLQKSLGDLKSKLEDLTTQLASLKGSFNAQNQP